MKNLLTRSGHATVVAYLALFLALGGGAFAIAGGSKISGNKLKKRSVAANRLKKHTITQTEVNLGKLGKVPTAGTADVANSLATMTPLKLTRTTSSATALTQAAAAAAAAQVPLYEDSHFKLYGKCFVKTEAPEELEAVVYIATKQNGAIYDSDDDERNGTPPNGYLDTATTEDLREVIDDSTLPNTANMQYEGDTEFGATAADGYTIQGVQMVAEKDGTLTTGDGPYGPGNVCMFSGYVIHS